MPLTTPETANEVVDRVLSDLYLALQPVGAKPFLRNSWLRAFAVAYANRCFDFYFALDEATKQVFPDTASATFLERIAAIWGLSRTAGYPATGIAVATGIAGSAIAAGTVLATGDGTEYVATIPATIAHSSLSVSSLTRSGSVATLVTSTPHPIGAVNVPITVSGADQSDYNVVEAEILEIVDGSTLTYSVANSPASPATGTISVAFNLAELAIESAEYSEEANLDAGDALQFQVVLLGVDDTVLIDLDGMSGGVDLETDEDLRARLLDRIHNPVAHFNAADIVAKAKTVAGVTRVYVREVTPNLGQVTVHFLRDNDASPIPGGSEVAAVKAVLDEIRPANTKYEDLIVQAPTARYVDFAFLELSPATSTMANAVKANLRQFFSEKTEVGENVKEYAYRSAIYNTVDPNTGDVLTSFSLAAPIGDVSIAEGEIALLGTTSGI